MGRAFRGTHQLAKSRDSHEKAISIKQELGQEAGKIDNLAELAAISLSEEDRDMALDFVNQIAAWLSQKGISGIEYPLKAYMRCIAVFEAVGNYERAQTATADAFNLLMRNANKISDAATRQAYLQKVPLHQEIYRRKS